MQGVKFDSNGKDQKLVYGLRRRYFWLWSAKAYGLEENQIVACFSPLSRVLLVLVRKRSGEKGK